MTTQVFTDGVTLSAASWANDVDTVTYAGLTTVAGTNTITAVGPASMTAYAARLRFLLIPANTNTGPTTVNLTCNSVALGARNIFANGAACVGGELVSGVPAWLVDDGTRFHIAGFPVIATQANQETATSVVTVVSPGRQQFHPSAAKGWVEGTFAGTAVVSYNVTSITDNGTGDETVNWTTVFSAGTYCAVGSAKTDGVVLLHVDDTTFAAGTTRINTNTSNTAALVDANHFMLAVFGDQ